jgi:hypothetical protein
MISHFQLWLHPRNFCPEETEIFVESESDAYSEDKREEM